MGQQAFNYLPTLGKVQLSGYLRSQEEGAGDFLGYSTALTAGCGGQPALMAYPIPGRVHIQGVDGGGFP